MNRTLALLTVGIVTLFVRTEAHAQIRITEWMYDGLPGEYIEFTNVGNTPIDMTGWVYDDDSRFTTVAAGGFSLSGFGIVQPHQVVVLTEANAATFRTAWGIPAPIVIVGGYTNNLGRNDEINLFNNAAALVDRLTYGDQNFPGTIRTQNTSGNFLPAALGTNNPAAAFFSVNGDAFGSHFATSGALGNPGVYPIPEPSTIGLSLLGLVGVALLRRGRRTTKVA